MRAPVIFLVYMVFLATVSDAYMANIPKVIIACPLSDLTMQRDNINDHPILEIINALREKMDLDYRQNLSILNDIVKAVNDISKMQTSGVNNDGPICDKSTRKSIRGILHNVVATDGSGIERNGCKVWGIWAYFGHNNENNFGAPANEATDSSFSAEINAIDNAMAIASNVGITFLSIITDSLQTKCILNAIFKGEAPDLGLVIDNISDDENTMKSIRNIIKMNNNFTSLVISWTKSHTGMPDPASHLNEHADRLAKEGALAALSSTHDDDVSDSDHDSSLAIDDDTERQATISSLSDLLSSPQTTNTVPLPF